MKKKIGNEINDEGDLEKVFDGIMGWQTNNPNNDAWFGWIRRNPGN